MIEIKLIEVTPIQQNCRVLYSTENQHAVVIDPGGDAEKISDFLEEKSLELKEIWLTHYHFDHCGGVQALKEKTNAKVLGHQLEKDFRGHVHEAAAMFGLAGMGMDNCPEPDVYLDEGEQLEFAGRQFEILFTPGHSPGHLCFYQAEMGILIAGDTVFQGSIGRTDLPGGNHELLIESIRSKILVLPEQTVIMPGHGPDTNVEEEKRTNPFLNS